MSHPDKPFFVGFLPAPGPLRAFLISCGISLVVVFAAVAWAIGTTQANPGDAAFYGRQNVTGVLFADPYPHVFVTEGTQRIPAGRTILLSAGGKRGVQGRAGDLDRALVSVSGQGLSRGDLDMIQVAGGRRGLNTADMAVAPNMVNMGDADDEMADVSTKDLGRWRLAGEICDGKCLAGAMRPGTGLAHRACANLCLVGGVPPVFVSSQPVEGSEFLLIGGPDGGPLAPEILDYTALYISVEGTVQRRGDLLIFLIDPKTIEAL